MFQTLLSCLIFLFDSTNSKVGVHPLFTLWLMYPIYKPYDNVTDEPSLKCRYFEKGKKRKGSACLFTSRIYNQLPKG